MEASTGTTVKADRVEELLGTDGQVLPLPRALRLAPCRVSVRLGDRTWTGPDLDLDLDRTWT
eukprot:2835355-Rhodomonas_salina.1